MAEGDDMSRGFDHGRPERPIVDAHVQWGAVEDAADAFATAVRARFAATKHHVLATLRSDGAPRVSGTEVILHDREMALGSMWGAVKARDLRRDGRFALHANPGDGSMEGGDAKVSGTAVELHGELAAAIAAGLPGGSSEPFHLFRLDIDLVVLSEVDEERQVMVIRSWRPDRGLVTAER